VSTSITLLAWVADALCSSDELAGGSPATHSRPKKTKPKHPQKTPARQGKTRQGKTIPNEAT